MFKLLSSLSLGTVAVFAGEKVPVYVYVDEWSLSGRALADEFVKLATAGVSTILMAFHLKGNPNFAGQIADTVLGWSVLSDTEKTEYVDKLHSLGCKLMVSSGGESEGTNWYAESGSSYARDVCSRVKKLKVDGIDFDKEGFGQMNAVYLSWMVEANTACREVWPGAIITAAPQSPHLIGDVWWSDTIKKGAPYDKLLIQYYNQGTWAKDTTYEGLFHGQGVGAINELWSRYPNVDKSTFVIGKPFLPEHAGAGYMDHAALRKLICDAWTQDGYRGGVMFWKAPIGGDYSDFTMLSTPCDNTPAPPVPSSKPTPITTTVSGPVNVPTTTRMGGVSSGAPTIAGNTGGSDTGIVSQCQARISSTGGQWVDLCKSYCAQYAPGGDLRPWCPAAETTDTLVACVTAQQSYCTKL